MFKYLEFKEAKCKNCYKCLKNCPVKAIKIENNQAKIIEDRCILCGKCTLICPQDAKKEHSENEIIKDLLKNEKVIATVAPSFIANFDLKGFEGLNEALKRIGFLFAEETARGAKVVVDEYEKLLGEKKYKNFITSCCPAINNMISLYYPNALKYLAPVDSPVITHAKILKKENPDCKIVFIGPCIAKKKECRESGIIDGVLTFEDLNNLFEEFSINLEDIEKEVEAKWNKARFFPISRGIIKSFRELVDGYEYIAVDGTERCKEVLEKIDDLENVFLELNACESSCINGPCGLNKKGISIISNTRVRKYVASNAKINTDSNIDNVDIAHEYKRQEILDREPSEEEIVNVLRQTGKYEKEDELNCGACGYASCREKAWAVINGYADIEMCLPYMREKAENMSYEIIQNSPNGIIVINSDYKVTDMNAKAKSLLGITTFRPKKDSIIDMLDESIEFITALNEKKNIYSKQLKILKTNSYIELSINYMQGHNVIFAIMKDITEATIYNEKLNKLKIDTLAATDAVIKKQMRTAQEIASLLGETTAETKVALVKLKETLQEGK